MRGGMIMVSDMFNNHLKARIDGLCNELSGLVANEADLISSGSFQSQGQGGQRQGLYRGGQQQQSGSGPVGRVSLFVPPPAGNPGRYWWPADLAGPPARVPRTTFVMPISRRPGVWQSKSTAG